MTFCYISVAFYFLLGTGLLLLNWKRIERKKKAAIGIASPVDIFRLSVNVDQQMVALDDELELLEAYLDLMCSHYPALRCEYDIDPALGGALLPNFILQPIAENSLRCGRIYCLSIYGKFHRRRDSSPAAAPEGGTMNMKKLRVLLVDDEIMIRKGFKRLFDWEALRLQITDYILKPVNYEEFGACIDRLKISLFEQRAAAEPEAQEERAITAITRYLQEHLPEELSLSVLSEEFHLNPQYISQLFRNEIGVGFLSYLTGIRMEKAKKLLLSSSRSIAEVAEQSGYGDYRVFTKVFKKHEGVTPSQFRRGFLEETT